MPNHASNQTDGFIRNFLDSFYYFNIIVSIGFPREQMVIRGKKKECELQKPKLILVLIRVDISIDLIL